MTQKFPSYVSEAIVDHLAGGQGSPEDVIDMVEEFGYEITVDEVVDIMLDENYEECPHCGVWGECFTMLPEDSLEPDGYCDNCR